MSQADSAAAPTLHAFEFRGTGGAYFRIWIVNLALTILTLGIFGAWAKVRTKRYFNGSTWVAGHCFDYHASAWRILIGRAIAFGLLVAYNLSVSFKPMLMLPWFLVGIFLFPWLVNSSIRFNARNTSYRNVRFNFSATDVDALIAFVVWPAVGFATLGLLMPAARRAKDYFYVNSHSYGGRYFETQFSMWRIYGVYAVGIALFVGILIALIGSVALTTAAFDQAHIKSVPDWLKQGGMLAFVAAFYIAILFIAPIVQTLIVNLSVSHTTLDERHRLQSRMSPLMVAWIAISNAFLTLITVGLFYPWAKVRLARYKMSKLAIIADGDIDKYVSESFETQSAVGEELGGALSFDFGL